MRRALPAHVKIADDAKEMVQECVSEFINFVTSQANEKFHGEYRKTVSPDDVVSTMGSLGFDNYIEPLSVFMDRHRSKEITHHHHHHHYHHRHAPYYASPLVASCSSCSGCSDGAANTATNGANTNGQFHYGWWSGWRRSLLWKGGFRSVRGAV